MGQLQPRRVFLRPGRRALAHPHRAGDAPWRRRDRMESAIHMTRRFPIRFDDWYRILSTVSFLPPSRAYVDVDDHDVHVRMGWAFRSRFPRSAIASITET